MTKRLFASLLAMLMLAGAAATLTGCNTVEGAGKDIQQGGKAIKDEANENKSPFSIGRIPTNRSSLTIALNETLLVPPTI